MATLTTEKHTGKVTANKIQHSNIPWQEGKKRRTIYLGACRYNRKTAERLKDIVEKLLFCRWNPDTNPDRATMQWLQDAPAEIRAKLEKVGLIATHNRYKGCF